MPDDEISDNPPNPYTPPSTVSSDLDKVNRTSNSSEPDYFLPILVVGVFFAAIGIVLLFFFGFL